jgi:hypothetical protein
MIMSGLVDSEQISIKGVLRSVCSMAVQGSSNVQRVRFTDDDGSGAVIGAACCEVRIDRAAEMSSNHPLQLDFAVDLYCVILPDLCHLFIAGACTFHNKKFIIFDRNSHNN